MARQVLACILAVGFLATAVLSVYYRDQATRLREQLAVAREEAREAQAKNPAAEAAAGAIARPAEKVSAAVARDALDQAGLIRRLEAELRNKDAQLAALKQSATNRAAEQPRPERRGQAWMENLRQSDPRQYVTLTNRREQVHQEYQTSLAEKADFMRVRDASALSYEDRIAYQRMAQLLDETWRLNQQLQTDLPAAERRAVLQKIRQNTRELEPMLSAERSREWYGLGVQLGYNYDEAQVFTDYLNKIIDLTSLQSIERDLRAGVLIQPPAAGGGSAPAPMPER